MHSDRTQRLKDNLENQAAWDQWFRVIYPRIYYVLFQKTSGNSARTEDLVGESIERFIRYKGLNKVENDRESVAYLAQTGIRLLADEIKSGKKESKAFRDKLWIECTPKQDERLDMETALSALSEEEQILMTMVIEGHSISEISKNLGISYSATGTRISRIRGKLRKTNF